MKGLTVIIPTYESWPLLERTVAAVLYDAQGLEVPFEVLVVDNESDHDIPGELRRKFGAPEGLRFFRRTGLRGRNFQPGAARNLGITEARYDSLVFLDADCIPAAEMLREYVSRLNGSPDTVLIGHREFVDTAALDPARVARERGLLCSAPRVASPSNYGRAEDRRLLELRRLSEHPRPYDCLFACNFAIHRDCLGELRFDNSYDGYWGYEDIDLGFRLHQRGYRFRYVQEAAVYHQEGGPVSGAARVRGRARNFPLIASRIPGFARYRLAGHRVGPVARPD